MKIITRIKALILSAFSFQLLAGLLLVSGILACWCPVAFAAWGATVPNPIMEYTYTYDSNGNITNIYNAVAISTSTFTYDEVDRITSAVGPYGSQNYTYDSVGNIQDVTDPTKDANGNATSYNNKTIEYNYDNRPTKITDTATNIVTEFAYDYSGQRIKKKVYNSATPANIQTTFYVGNIYEESYIVDASSPILASTTTVTYVYAGSIRVAGLSTRTTATGTEENTYYYHGDHLGSSSIITDETGAVIRSVSYQPWGNVHTNTQESGASTDYNPPQKFTGQILDDSTGLYYYGARYYDPQLRRFITPDTIVQSPFDPQSLNRYAYVRNNPLNLVDPTGHSFWSQWGGTIISLGFTFAGMPYMGALMGSTFSTVANKGHLDDFALGLAVGSVSGYAGGSIAGGMARGMGMNMAGIGVAAMRGGLAGAISGGGMAAIYNQDIGKGALNGAIMGAAMGSAVWAKNAYVTNQFLKNNVSWDSSVSASDRDTFTQGIKEAGQSPLGQRTFGKYIGDGRTITIHSTTEIGGYVPNSSPNDVYLNPDIAATKSGSLPSYVQGDSLNMATLMLHEMGHSSSYNGKGMMGDPLNVSYNENPYRAWIGTPGRTGYYSGGDVQFKQWLYQY